MKEENAHRATIRVVEYSAIMVFFLLILIILVPSISKIVYNMAKQSSITSTKGTIDTVKSFYVDMNLLNEVGLPFKVVFDKDGYTFYEMNKKVNYERHLNIKNIGEEVELAGWVQKVRNLGGMIFIDLRDEFGITQIVVNNEELQEEAKELNTESCIHISRKSCGKNKQK